MAEDTQTMGSIINDAVKEGIDFNPNSSPEPSAKPDVSKDSSPTTKESPVQKESTPTEGAKSAEQDDQESKIPAHLNPRFQQLYGEKKKLAQELEEARAALRDPRIVKFLARGQETTQEEQPKETPKRQALQLTPEQEEAIAELKERLGINQYDQVIKQLKSDNDKYAKEAEDKVFEAEEADLRKLANDYGLSYDEEVLPELTDWLTKNPSYQGLGAGSLKIAFNNAYFSKIGELERRKSNKLMIEEREKLKSNQTEPPVKVQSNEPARKHKKETDLVQDLIQQAGGVDGIDFSS